MKLPRDFYQREDVLAISRELLGKVLCSRLDGTVTRVVITETEAYAGVEDRASHAFGNRRTRRTEPMFGAGGIAYVYLCYGIHHLFNVVTAGEGVPHAVLVRAGTPLEGHEFIAGRRGMRADDKRLLAGPGSLARGLGITTALTGESLLGKRVWIEDRGIEVEDEAIRSGPRIGVDYAGEDALLPYRFILDKPPA
jgi:DNA-3-methyladenine glycosylase